MENYRHWLGKKVTVVIDRPLGSAHPKFPQTVYPVNYGYIPGIFSSVDHEAIDAYVLGPTKPLQEFTGKVIAVLARDGDGEMKLIVADSKRYGAEEIEQQVYFVERYYPHRLWLSSET
jgi:inorganic pyrophosphatase